MHWLEAPACCSSAYLWTVWFFFLNAICLFDIYGLLISTDLWVFAFCVQNVFQPSSPLLSRSPLCPTFSLIFYALSFSLRLALLPPRFPSPSPTSLSLRLSLPLSLSLWTPSPSLCLFVSPGSPLWLMPPFIFPLDLWGVRVGRCMRMCEWTACALAAL